MISLHQLTPEPSGSFYLPMHGVTKESSTTTKLRIVFDGSAKTSSEKSLNDSFLPGLSLYPLLCSVINKFRLHTIGISGDISKIFREIALLPEEHDFHCFLCKHSVGDLVDCRMIRLMFGIASSPYLASQVLCQLTLDYKDTHPRAAEIIRTTFCVDDCLTGAVTLQEATTLRVELNSLLDKACMTLQKWRSNSTNLLQTIPEELKGKSILDVSLSPVDQEKALGLRWDTGKDVLAIFIPPIQACPTATKRAVCSLITRTFDVLGWYSPALMPAKLLLQELWTLKLA